MYSALVGYNNCQGETGSLLSAVSPSVCLDPLQYSWAGLIWQLEMIKLFFVDLIAFLINTIPALQQPFNNLKGSVILCIL